MILREAFDYEFSTLDPRDAAHIDPPAVAVYETLVVKDEESRPRSGLAESWQQSEDGLTWRLQLRSGARFHSGAPCDARATVAALEHLRWGDAREDQLWYWDPVDEVRAEDARSLVFTLHHPYPRLPSLLWGTHTAIHNEAMRRDVGSAYGRECVDGTGPFRLLEWSPERVIVARRPDARGLRPRLDRIEWLSILDEEERLAALERGQVHSVHGPPLAEVERLREDGRFVVIEFPQSSNAYLALDWRRRDLGFDDRRVRKGISLALDRATIVREALAGHGAPTLGPLAPGAEYYSSEIDRHAGFDPKRAQEFLVGKQLAFECLCQDDPVHRRIATCVREQLARVGVRLELRFVRPFAGFYEACGSGPAAFINKWLWQDALDAVIGFTSSRCRGFPNWQHASVPKLDAAFRAWLRAETREELASAAGQVQRITADELPYIPLVTPTDIWAHTKGLHGWRPHPADLYPTYEEAWLDAEG